ncbi:cytochrome c oxidase assembly protein, partial [Klebsiella pneumoniae]
MTRMDWLEWLIPWEFSPTLVAAFVVAIVLFVRGQRVHHVTAARQWLFWSGMVLLYLSMHTRLDYYAERMFFIHRAQHLVLHHLGPLLVMAA